MLRVTTCTHQTTGLAVREKLAFSSAQQLGEAYRALREKFPESEVVVLSTCNRVEVYTAQDATSPTDATVDVAGFLAEFHQVPRTDFEQDLREHTGPEAVQHLFRVISSLDSMVLGEPQIVTQVKDAYQQAMQHNACGPLTHALFQGALRTSNRVRTETKLSTGRVSIASVAVGEFAKGIFSTFHDKLVLVVGAGEMAEETLRYLKDEGVQRLLVINRSPERAQRLAEEWQGEARPWHELGDWLGRADVIVSTTGATEPIVTREVFLESRAAAGRTDPVFVLDLGAPRDFEPAIGQLEDVFLYDIDSLQTVCDRNRRARQREVQVAEKIILDETDRFMAEFYNRASSAIVTRLREDWHSISQQELEALYRKLPHLNADDRDAVARTVGRIVNKLLHPPLEALRDEARSGTPHGLVDALKRLFGLQERP